METKDAAQVFKAGDETLVVIMLKDGETGFLEKELLALRIQEHEGLIVNIFAAEQDGAMLAHLKLTTDRDVEDWEFAAIYDYYDSVCFNEEVLNVSELEDCYNPTWEVVFPFADDPEVMSERINKILDLHQGELKDVYNAIQSAEVRQEYERAEV